MCVLFYLLVFKFSYSILIFFCIFVLCQFIPLTYSLKALQFLLIAVGVNFLHSLNKKSRIYGYLQADSQILRLNGTRAPHKPVDSNYSVGKQNVKLNPEPTSRSQVCTNHKRNLSLQKTAQLMTINTRQFQGYLEFFK